MQSVSFRIWTRVAVSISYDANDYTTGMNCRTQTSSSDPMMTFVFYNSSMNTEVALQPQPRGTESWTVGELEVSCRDHCRGCSAVSLSGSSEFLASSRFKVGSSSVNRAFPFWSVHGISLQVSRIDVAPLEIGFDRVFIPQFWSTLIYFAGRKVPYIRRLVIWHSSMRITCPTNRSWALMMVASKLVDLAWSRTSRLEMWFCHLIPKMEQRARQWKSSSFLICLRYSVQVSQP